MGDGRSLLGVGQLLSGAGQLAAGAAGRAQAESNASRLERTGQVEARARRIEGRRLRARQRAVAAKSGISLGSTSFQDVFADTAAKEELAALRTRAMFRFAADDQRTRGVLTMIRGIFGASSSLLDASSSRATAKRGGNAPDS